MNRLLQFSVCKTPTEVKSAKTKRSDEFLSRYMVEDDCNYWVGQDGEGHEIVLDFGCITVIDRYNENQKTVEQEDDFQTQIITLDEYEKQ